MSRKQVVVRVAESAAQDLEDIIVWYTSKNVPEVGANLLTRIREHLSQIELFPRSGRIVPEYNDPSIRELVIPPFRVVYRLDEARANVVRVWRSERLMLELPEE